MLGQFVTDQHFVLNRSEYFIDAFLDDARAFWSSKCKEGLLHSGTWVQTDEKGIKYTFEAIASILNDQPILVVQHINGSSLDIGRILQAEQKGVSTREEMDATVCRDDPTGLYNRHGFFLQAEERLLIARCKQQPVTIAYIELDRVANENYNDMIRNQLLSNLAIRFKKILRRDDILGRVSDGDFLIMLPNMSDENTDSFRSRLNQTIDNWNLQFETSLQISFSIGLVSVDTELHSLEQMVSQAELNMYINRKSSNHSKMASCAVA